MRRLVLLFYVLLALAAFSAAQVTPPPGWTVQNTGSAIIMFSPGEPSSRIALTLLPPGSPIGNVKSWFGNQVMALAQASGRTLGATAVTEQEGILLRVVQVENQNHMKLRLLFYGYPSAHGLSIPILMIPPAVSDQDPRLETANQYVQQLAGQKL